MRLHLLLLATKSFFTRLEVLTFLKGVCAAVLTWYQMVIMALLFMTIIPAIALELLSSARSNAITSVLIMLGLSQERFALVTLLLAQFHLLGVTQ